MNVSITPGVEAVRAVEETVTITMTRQAAGVICGLAGSTNFINTPEFEGLYSALVSASIQPIYAYDNGGKSITMWGTDYNEVMRKTSSPSNLSR